MLRKISILKYLMCDDKPNGRRKTIFGLEKANSFQAFIHSRNFVMIFH